MKTLNEIIELLTEEYYSRYMSGSWNPWDTLYGKIEMVVLIYGIDKDEVYKQIKNKAHPNHALMMAEE